jgi:ketosteroid isomerase-like protein
MHGIDTRSAMELLHNLFAVETEFVASGAGDARALGRAFHPEVVVHEPQSLPYAGEWHRLEGIAALFRRMHETWSEMNVHEMTAARLGDTVLMTCRITLVARRNGARIEQPFAEVLRFEDGLLRDGTPFYFDTGAIAAALAASPQ